MFQNQQNDPSSRAKSTCRGEANAKTEGSPKYYLGDFRPIKKLWGISPLCPSDSGRNDGYIICVRGG